MNARRWFGAVCAVFIAMGVAFAVVFALTLNPFRSLPSDSSLVARFQEHRANLDALVATALPDTDLEGSD